MVPALVKLIPAQTAFLFCDLQTRFRTHNSLVLDPFNKLFLSGSAIHGFESLVTTGNKLIKAANVGSFVSSSQFR